MQLIPVTDPAFARYGTVLDLPADSLFRALADTPCPPDRTVYQPGDPALEETKAASYLERHVYGGMPIQVGYCNGANHTLNCLEYHRGSEINLTADEIVLLLAPLQAVQDGKLSTDLVEAFLVPAKTAVQLYETTLHYAPCCAPGASSFRVAIVLPSGTNTDRPDDVPVSAEDHLLWARNKWLLAHPDAPEAAQGAYVGLTGKNLTV